MVQQTETTDRGHAGERDAAGRPTALVIGGGLAGLTVARQLQRHGFQVTLLEATDRVGGKAGSDAGDAGSLPRPGALYEHGYHIFAPWYVNVREILDELRIELVPVERWNYVQLRKDGPPRRRTLGLPSGPAELIEAVRNSPIPAFDTLLYFYFVLDMVGLPLSRKELLDQQSRCGLMRGRWYMTRWLPRIEQESLLKASAVPVHHMSAFTAKILSAYYLKAMRPPVAMLPGDLQQVWIEPFRESVAKDGVDVCLRERVTRLSSDDGRTITSASVEGREKPWTADVYVVTTPLDVTRRLVGGEVFALDPDLGNIQRLEVAPMAALQLELEDLRDDLPREHTFLSGGRYGLSFIDLTPHWPGLRTTHLSFISSDFAPIRDLEREEQYHHLMDEIGRYLGIREADVRHWNLNPNTEPGSSLFINTVGAWRDRPATSCRIPNLFFAGDWVKNEIDLACMEGAVSAALEAAHRVGRAFEGRRGVRVPPKPKVAERYPPWLVRAVVLLLAPSMGLVYAAARALDWMRSEEVAGAP